MSLTLILRWLKVPADDPTLRYLWSGLDRVLGHVEARLRKGDPEREPLLA